MPIYLHRWGIMNDWIGLLLDWTCVIIHSLSDYKSLNLSVGLERWTLLNQYRILGRDISAVWSMMNDWIRPTCFGQYRLCVPWIHHVTPRTLFTGPQTIEELVFQRSQIEECITSWLWLMDFGQRTTDNGPNDSPRLLDDIFQSNVRRKW